MGRSSTHSAGTTVDAGLPNITGRIPMISSSPARDGGVATGSTWYQGAFENSSTIVSPRPSTRIGYADNGFETYYNYFNASKSNAIYGNSTTVQPAAYYVYIWQRKS